MISIGLTTCKANALCCAIAFAPQNTISYHLVKIVQIKCDVENIWGAPHLIIHTTFLYFMTQKLDIAAFELSFYKLKVYRFNQ